MVCSYCLKDVVLAESRFIFCGRPTPPSQIFRVPPAWISNPDVRLVSAYATMNSSVRYDGRCFLAVFSQRRTRDVLKRNGRFIHGPISDPTYYSILSGKDSPAARRVRADSSADKQGDHDPSKSHGSIFNAVRLISGIIGLLIKLIPKFLLPFWSKEKNTFLKIAEDVKEAAEVVEEVVEDVKEIAELSEKIAEEVEGKTREEGFVHKTAELVENFSKEVVKDAEAVENMAQTVAQTAKTVDEIVEDITDGVEDVGDDNISKGLPTSSSSSADQSLKGSSVQSSKLSNSADIPSKLGIEISEGIVRWLVRLLVGGGLTYADISWKGVRLVVAVSVIAVFCMLSIVFVAWGGVGWMPSFGFGFGDGVCVGVVDSHIDIPARQH